MGFMNKNSRYQAKDGTYTPYNMDVESLILPTGERLFRMVFLGEKEERLCAVLIDRDGLDALRDVITQIVGDRP